MGSGRMIATVAAVVATAAFSSIALAQQAVRIGTSSVGSNFYVSAVGISEVVQQKAGINTTVQAVGGSAANVRGLGAKRIEFAISNAFSAYAGFQGTYGFDGQRIPVRLVVQGHTNERAILVRKNAGIKTPADLAGRTFVGERRALPELALITEEFLKVHGLKDKRVNVVATTTTDEVFRAFAAGSIDAVLLPTGPRSGNVEKALNDGHVEFLSWDPAKRDEILKNLPELMFAGTYTPSDFEGLDKEVPVIAMRTYFITSTFVEDEIVYKVAKAMYENTKELATYQRALAQWTLENSLKNIAMPFHDGAIRYFREKNVWTDEMDARQKAMLTK